MSIDTRTTTYTVLDVRRVLDSFAADFAMIAQATRLRSRDNVANTVADLKVFAEIGYLSAIHLILWDAGEQRLRATTYTISTNAIGWTDQQPGNNLWPCLPSGRLQVIATLSSDWWAMDEASRIRFRTRYSLHWAWGLTNTDTSFSDMAVQVDRHYTSNGYGMRKTIYS